jgi:glyoxylase-like metal-dependent hydrolase (beta-lactamase superfamily II)/rhodanese-related sulfurtransferase
MTFRQLYDAETSTYTYLLADDETKEAILIDPVLEKSDRDLQLLQEFGFTLKATLETHVHADHVTGASLLREKLGSQAIVGVDAGDACSCADRYVAEGELIQFGKRSLKVIQTPGHTNGCISFYDEEGQRVFTGDALLIRGCGRTDFQQGDPKKLYHSVRNQLLQLPEETLVYPGHDYQGRTVSSVKEEKAHNGRLRDGISEEQFVEIMANLKLAKPKHIDRAVPANQRCGIERQDGEQTPWAPLVKSPEGVDEVEPLWLQNHLGEVTVLDVREDYEIHSELGHISGIVHVSLGQVPQALDKLPKDGKIVVVCRSGARSGRAMLFLKQQGYEKVASLRGGMLSWNSQRLPVVAA